MKCIQILLACLLMINTATAVSAKPLTRPHHEPLFARLLQKLESGPITPTVTEQSGKWLKTSATYLDADNDGTMDSNSRYVYSYNSFDSLSELKKYTWEFWKRWASDSMPKYYYYDNMHRRVLTERKIVQYDGTEITLTRDSTLYDSLGNVTYVNSYVQDSSGWRLFQVVKTAYTYTSSGQPLSILGTYKDTGWHNDYRYDYFYDTSGNVTALKEYWADDSGSFHLMSSFTALSFYNNDFRKPSAFIQDIEYGMPVNKKYTITYDKSGHILSSRREIKDSVTLLWILDGRATYRYNEHGDRYYFSDSARNYFMGADSNYYSKTLLLQSAIFDSLMYDQNDNLIIDRQTVQDDSDSFLLGEVIYTYSIATRLATLSETGNPAFIVYPDPAADVLFVKTSSIKGIKELTISTLSGKMIWNQAVSGTADMEIPIQNLSKGMYLIHAITCENDFSQKFIKQ